MTPKIGRRLERRITADAPVEQRKPGFCSTALAIHRHGWGRGNHRQQDAPAVSAQRPEHRHRIHQRIERQPVRRGRDNEQVAAARPTLPYRRGSGELRCQSPYARNPRPGGCPAVRRSPGKGSVPASPIWWRERFGSPSTSIVLARAWRYAARWTAVVVLPTPPLNDATVTIIELLTFQNFRSLKW